MFPPEWPVYLIHSHTHSHSRTPDKHKHAHEHTQTHDIRHSTRGTRLNQYPAEWNTTQHTTDGTLPAHTKTQWTEHTKDTTDAKTQHHRHAHAHTHPNTKHTRAQLQAHNHSE